MEHLLDGTSMFWLLPPIFLPWICKEGTQDHMSLPLGNWFVIISTHGCQQECHLVMCNGTVCLFIYLTCEPSWKIPRQSIGSLQALFSCWCAPRCEVAWEVPHYMHQSCCEFYIGLTVSTHAVTSVSNELQLLMARSRPCLSGTSPPLGGRRVSLEELAAQWRAGLWQSKHHWEARWQGEHYKDGHPCITLEGSLFRTLSTLSREWSNCLQIESTGQTSHHGKLYKT